MIKNHIIKKLCSISSHFYSMNGQLLEFTAFCFVFDMFWSYWKHIHIIRKLCDDFFDFTPTEIEHFSWEWPIYMYVYLTIVTNTFAHNTFTLCTQQHCTEMLSLCVTNTFMSTEMLSLCVTNTFAQKRFHFV